eukprot:11763564-Karenia_brevis.AAC.1
MALNLVQFYMPSSALHCLPQICPCFIMALVGPCGTSGKALADIGRVHCDLQCPIGHASQPCQG